MNIEFTARQYRLSEEIKEYAEKKLTKLEPFVEEPVDVHLIFETEKLREIAEIHVSHRFGHLQASESTDDMRDSVLAVIETVTKQARRSKKKFLDKRRRSQRQMEDNGWPMEVLEGDSLAATSPRVIKTTNLPIKPMSVEQASVALDESKNDFFVFLDSSTDKVSVLVRRKDNNFGLIAPEF